MVRQRSNGSTPEYGEMGDRLRDTRRERGLSLRTLAGRLGVSPSLISQVETGRAKPSVSTLYAIANELGISLDELLFIDARAVPGAVSGASPAAPGSAAAAAEAPTSTAANGPAGGLLPEVRLPVEPVQRAAARPVIRLASGVIWERLTTASIPNVDFLHVTYEVGGASSPEMEFQRHPGQEWGYVLSGSLGVRIGFDEYVLTPGDSIAFDSTTPHRLFNAGQEPVHGIWFVLGRRSVDIGPVPAHQAGALRDRH